LICLNEPEALPRVACPQDRLRIGLPRSDIPLPRRVDSQVNCRGNWAIDTFRGASLVCQPTISAIATEMMREYDFR
jgi:hypothetical protein